MWGFSCADPGLPGGQREIHTEGWLLQRLLQAASTITASCLNAYCKLPPHGLHAAPALTSSLCHASSAPDPRFIATSSRSSRALAAPNGRSALRPIDPTHEARLRRPREPPHHLPPPPQCGPDHTPHHDSSAATSPIQSFAPPAHPSPNLSLTPPCPPCIFPTSRPRISPS